MVFLNYVLTGLMTVTAIILLWVISNEIIKKRRIAIFLPFLLSFVLIALASSFSLNGIFDPFIWFFLEFPWFIVIIWIVVNLWGEND